MMKKKIAAILAGVQLLCAGSALAAGTQPVTIRLNGTQLTLPAEAFIENDRTLVPLRGVFEAVGASVMWEPETKSIFISKNIDGNMQAIIMQIGYTDVFVGEEKKSLDVAPKLVGDYTYVPLRFVIDELGEQVDWNGETYTVDITTK